MGSFSRGDSVHHAGGVGLQVRPGSGYGPAGNEDFGSKAWAAAPAPGRVVHTTLIARAIQTEILPRLVQAHQGLPGTGLFGAEAGADEAAVDIDEFVHSLLCDTDAPSFDLLGAVRRRGTPMETICLELLAPAARLLGEFWSEDLCDMTQVTVGVGRLQRMLNSMASVPQISRQIRAKGLSVLLLPVPGEQHTFGLSMVAEFFRSGGWDVRGGPHTNLQAALGLLKQCRFDAIGFTLGSERHLDALGDAIDVIRRAAGADGPGVFVGGSVFAQHPEYVSHVRADMLVDRGDDAPVLAEKFVLENRVNR